MYLIEGLLVMCILASAYRFVCHLYKQKYRLFSLHKQMHCMCIAFFCALCVSVMFAAERSKALFLVLVLLCL